MNRTSSPWSSLRYGAYRSLWLGGVIVNLAVWMQNVGAAWIMTTLDPSPFMVGLVQTATALPAFLLGLPGGVLADSVERRRWLLFTQSLMLGSALLLCALALAGRIAPWPLLALTFVLGIGNALNMSAWMAASVSVLPREQVASASALNGVSYNLARVLGPALAGILVATTGALGLFGVVAACFLIVTGVLWCWRALPRETSLPAERLLAGIASGLRYVRHSPPIRNALLRTLAFVTPASAIWALLPLVARTSLGLGAEGYGVLVGSLGAGGVLSIFLQHWLRRRLTLRTTVIGGSIAFAAVTIAAVYLQSLAAMSAALVFGGVGWMTANSTLVAVVQTSAAGWVRARVASVYLLVMMGAMAVGGAIWGVVADHVGVANALLLAATAAVLATLWTWKVPLVMGADADFASAAPIIKPLVGEEPAHDDGPITVEIFYSIAPESRAEFIRLAYAIRPMRRRNGATSWRLYRDFEQPNRYVERFIVLSWLDYLRLVERTTRADRAIEEGMQRLQSDPPPMACCYIAERHTIMPTPKGG